MVKRVMASFKRTLTGRCPGCGKNVQLTRKKSKETELKEKGNAIGHKVGVLYAGKCNCPYEKVVYLKCVVFSPNYAFSDADPRGFNLPCFGPYKTPKEKAMLDRQIDQAEGMILRAYLNADWEEMYICDKTSDERYFL